MLKKFLKNERGLTLIELLAVIVILGIVAAIAIPSVMNIIQKSKIDAVKADAQQILSAAKTYAASNSVDDNGNITETQLSPYISNSKLNTSDKDDFSVTVTNNGQDFSLTTTSAVPAGSATIKFTGATSKGISDSNASSGNITIDK